MEQYIYVVRKDSINQQILDSPGTPLSSLVRYSTVDFYDKMNGIVTGQNGLILRTRDGGATFEQIVIPGAPTLIDFQSFFFDSLNIFIKLHQNFIQVMMVVGHGR
jgi:hypothetical protein